MRGHRLTLGGMAALVALVALAALVLAAWRASTYPASLAVLAGAVLALQAATIMAAKGKGRSRRFWLGFALCGLPYLVASQATALRNRLPTQALLERITGKILSVEDYHMEVAMHNFRVQQARVGTAGRSSSIQSLPVSGPGTVRFTNFGATEVRHSIGHSVAAILLAFVGGLLFLIPALIWPMRPDAADTGSSDAIVAED